MCILCLFQLNAQTTQTKTIGNDGGTSVSGKVLPMATNQESYHSQQIYTAAELEIPKGSKITSLSFNVSSVPNNKNATCDITVRLGNTSDESFNGDTFKTSGSSTATKNGVVFSTGWVKFDFTDFTYEGNC